MNVPDWFKKMIDKWNNTPQPSSYRSGRLPIERPMNKKDEEGWVKKDTTSGRWVKKDAWGSGRVRTAKSGTAWLIVDIKTEGTSKPEHKKTHFPGVDDDEIIFSSPIIITEGFVTPKGKGSNKLEDLYE